MQSTLAEPLDYASVVIMLYIPLFLCEKKTNLFQKNLQCLYFLYFNPPFGLLEKNGQVPIARRTKILSLNNKNLEISSVHLMRAIELRFHGQTELSNDALQGQSVNYKPLQRNKNHSTKWERAKIKTRK